MAEHHDILCCEKQRLLAGALIASTRSLLICLHESAERNDASLHAHLPYMRQTAIDMATFGSAWLSSTRQPGLTEE